MHSVNCTSPHLAITVSTKRFFFQFGFIVLAILSCASTGAAQQPEALKVVFRRSGPKIAANSVEGQPITLYKAGDKYTRIEYPADPASHNHILVITKEPDNWVINLEDHTGKHRLDPGPTFVSRNPIVWTPKRLGEPDPYQAFRDLEFGNEALFVRQKGARDLGVRNISGKSTRGFVIKDRGVEVTLFLEPETDKPVQVDLTEDGKLVMSFHYLEYDSSLRFDPALFEVPQGTKISEAK